MSVMAEQTPAIALEATSIGNDGTNSNSNNEVCRYYLRGICRFGDFCRFSHDTGGAGVENISDITSTSSVPENEKALSVHNDSIPSTSHRNWLNAPVFVPSHKYVDAQDDNGICDVAGTSGMSAASWAEVVGGTSAQDRAKYSEQGSLDEVCPFESPCPYGIYCAYSIHMELCEMCDQYCLHPSDQAQRKKHNRECLQQHEQAMELSFAIARSKDKTCGICFDTIMEKAGREKRFGILPNCSHIFCLECIRKWRQAKQFEHKISRSCPECRVCSDFVCPSAYWVETKEEKNKLLDDYRKALGAKDCKYFKKGDGKCPFGNKCFYKHALPSGEVVDVGGPKRTRKIHRNTDELINLLDNYLWDFVDRRNYHWLDLFSSDVSDDSDWSDEYTTE